MSQHARSFAKSLLRQIVEILFKFPNSSYIKQLIIDKSLTATKTISHNKTYITLSTPNPICKYRVNTFSSKEPETLDWIDSFNSDDVFWDIGANIGIYSIYAALHCTKD